MGGFKPTERKGGGKRRTYWDLGAQGILTETKLLLQPVSGDGMEESRATCNVRHFEERIYWFIFKRGRIRCRICKKNIFSKNENHALSFIIKPTSRSGSGL